MERGNTIQKIQINRHVTENIRLPKFALSFVSAGAQIDYMASLCPCVFGYTDIFHEQVTCILVMTVVGTLTYSYI